jgi:hypothetical protein
VELAEQGPGSLTTTASGTISADLIGGFDGPAAIRMLGSDVIGVNNGSWLPGVAGVGGAEPANVGGQVDAGPSLGSAAAAVRNFHGDIVSDAVAFASQSGGVYTAPSTDPIFYLAFDLDVAGYGPLLSATFPPGRYSFTGTTLNHNDPGTDDSRLEISGNVATLIVPVNIFYFTPLVGGGPSPDQEVSGRFHLVGALVATAEVPEACGTSLIGIATSAWIGMHVRFRNRKLQTER